MTGPEARIKTLWSEISWKLSRGGILSGGDAFNFTATIELFRGASPVIGETATIKELLGPRAALERVVVTNWDELSTQVNKCLSWPGLDEDSQPNRRYQLSAEFNKDISEAFSMMRTLFQDAIGFWEFGLSDGHPFYPVYWDFAYLIKRPERDYVFIGSSSD